NYDRYGNRLGQSVTSGAAPQNWFNYSNNRITNAPFQYDLNGNMTADGNHTYSYDAAGRIASVDNGATASYIYNASGALVSKTVIGITRQYVHDATGYTEFDPSTGNWTRADVEGIASYIGGTSGQTYFPIRDHLGNLRVLVNSAGAVQQQC